MEFMGESVYTKPFSDDTAVHFRHQAIFAIKPVM